MHDQLLIAILAAGASRRLGQPKQFVKTDGQSLLRRQCRVAIESHIAPVALICGCHADLCIAEITDLPVAIRRNEQWREGIASSIRDAVQAALENDALALLILHADQYRITSMDLRTLHAAWVASGREKVCRSFYEDYAGPPIIFPAAMFGKLMQLRGDEGARALLATLGLDLLLNIPLPNAVFDLDLPSQLLDIKHELAQLGRR